MDAAAIRVTDTCVGSRLRLSIFWSYHQHIHPQHFPVIDSSVGPSYFLFFGRLFPEVVSGVTAGFAADSELALFEILCPLRVLRIQVKREPLSGRTR